MRVNIGAATLAVPLLMLLEGAFAQAPVQGESDDAAQSPGWSAHVIELDYADAFEVAALLSAIAPPGVRIVPYGPTNSLIISTTAAIAPPQAPRTQPGTP